MSNDDDEVTDWKLYRVSFSWDKQQWAIFEQVGTTLELFDGYWDSEIEAGIELEKLNANQNVPINV